METTKTRQCTCPQCVTPELKAAIVSATEKVSALNHRAFQLYCADLDAGREPGLAFSYYLLAMDEQLAGRSDY